jgi:hypothetical protein
MHVLTIKEQTFGDFSLDVFPILCCWEGKKNCTTILNCFSARLTGRKTITGLAD